MRVLSLLLFLLGCKLISIAVASKCMAIPSRRYVKTCCLTNRDLLYLPETFEKVDHGANLNVLGWMYAQPIKSSTGITELVSGTRILKRNTSFHTYIYSYMSGLKEPIGNEPLHETFNTISILDTNDYGGKDYPQSDLYSENFYILQHVTSSPLFNSTEFIGLSLIEASTPDRNYYYHLEYKMQYTIGQGGIEDVVSLDVNGILKRIREFMFLNLCSIAYTKKKSLSLLGAVHSHIDVLPPK